jgi:AcrR family transcriptional regulator
VSRRDRSGLREDIIKASLELGGELGEEGLTMRGIAARLGVSATALYQHFESKAQILREIRHYGLESLSDALRPAQSETDPVEQLRRQALNYVSFARDNPWLYSILMEEDQVDWKDLLEEEARGMLAPVEMVRVCLRAGAAQGKFRKNLDPDTGTFQLWAAVHGLSSLLLSGRVSTKHPALPVADEDAFVDAFVTGMIDGFTG